MGAPSHPNLTEFLQFKEVYISLLIRQKSFLSFLSNDSMCLPVGRLSLYLYFTSNYKQYYCEIMNVVKHFQLTTKEVQDSKMFIVLCCFLLCRRYRTYNRCWICYQSHIKGKKLWSLTLLVSEKMSLLSHCFFFTVYTSIPYKVVTYYKNAIL